MTWLNDTIYDFSGLSYHKTWSEKYPANIEENILIDSVDKKIEDIIVKTFNSYFSDYLELDLNSLTNSLETKKLRETLARKAHSCSNELKENLPVMGYPSYQIYLNERDNIIKSQKEKYNLTNETILLWSYYLDNMKGEKKLSEITKYGFLDCVSHSLSIKTALDKNGFKIYNEKEKPYIDEKTLEVKLPMLVHAMTAIKLGDYYLRIDPLHDKGNCHDTFLNYKLGFTKSFMEANIR